MSFFYRHIIFIAISTSGMEHIDSTVVMNVISVISLGSRSYFMQNIVPKAATNVAVTVTLRSFRIS